VWWHNGDLQRSKLKENNRLQSIPGKNGGRDQSTYRRGYISFTCVGGKEKKRDFGRGRERRDSKGTHNQAFQKPNELESGKMAEKTAHEQKNKMSMGASCEKKKGQGTKVGLHREKSYAR